MHVGHEFLRGTSDAIDAARRFIERGDMPRDIGASGEPATNTPLA